MKKKYLIILIVLMIFSVGCKSEETASFNNGQAALENHEYDKAQKYLSNVLEQDSKNETARSMYMQAIKMSKAEYYKDKGFYSKAIDCLDSIVNINNGSQKIKVESETLKKELEKLQSESEESANIRKENAKEVAKKAVEKSEQEFYIWQKNQEKDNEPKSDKDEEEKQEDSSDENIIDSIKNKLGEIFKF